MKHSSIFAVIRKEYALMLLTWDLYQPESNRHTCANLLIGGKAVKGNRQLTIGPTAVSIISPILIRTIKIPEEFLYKYVFLISSPMPSGLAILKREPQFSGYFVTITKILKAISIEMGIRAKLLLDLHRAERMPVIINGGRSLFDKRFFIFDKRNFVKKICNIWTI